MKKLNRSITGGIFILILSLSGILNVQAQNADTLFQPICDAELRQNQPLANFNLLSTITISPRYTFGQSKRAIIRYDLNFDSLPENIQVTSAKLRLYTVSVAIPGSSKEVAVHRVTNDWDELSTSWNIRGNSNWNTSGGDFIPTPTGITDALGIGQWIELDVTSDLQAFRLDSTLNKGWMIKVHSNDNSGLAWTYASKEYIVSGFRPQLVINYGFFLPVVYKDLSAKAEADNVKLEWLTSKEIDNDRFEVERSLDGKTWEHIGTIGGKGFSSNTLKYAFTDYSPAAGINYYRLKQFDFNGKYSYSQIVKAEVEKTVISINTISYKNRLDVMVSSEKNYLTTILIVDLAGRIIFDDDLHIEKGNNTFSLTFADLVPGLYLVVVDNGEELITSKTFLK